MPAPRPNFTTALALALLACVCPLSADARAARHLQEQAQPPSTTFTEEVRRGVELYRQGEYEEAAKAFKKAASRKEDDPDAWHFLGLTYAKLGKQKDALEDFEKAIVFSFEALDPKHAVHSEDIRKLTSEEQEARHIKLTSDFRRAADIVEDYLSLRPPGAGFWQSQLESLRFYAAQPFKPTAQASDSEHTDAEQKAQILSRPAPLYTEEARAHGVSGLIRVRLFLASNGTVQHVLALNFLPYGLSEQTVAAARAIKFVPAMKDGHPVSEFVTIQYNFNVR